MLGLVALSASAASTATAAAAPTTPAPLAAHGSVQQIYVTGVTGTAPLVLFDRHGRALASRRADRLGAALFRNLTPGQGYHLRQRVGNGFASSPTLRVLPDTSAPPSTRAYSQRIPISGYGYLTTRDGTRLAIDVRLPLSRGRGRTRRSSSTPATATPILPAPRAGSPRWPKRSALPSSM